MILVIILLFSFLLSLWLLTRQGKTRPPRSTEFRADLRSGTYREIDPGTQRVTSPMAYLESNSGHRLDSRKALDNFFGPRSNGARPERRPHRGIGSSFHSREASAELKLVTCVACTDPIPQSNTIAVPCGDTYCAECLITLFSHATKDESMYPPRCCGQVIPLVSVRDVASVKVYAHFSRKAVEFETTDRTYCINPSCLRFVPLHHIVNNIATCCRCGVTTCSLCKAAAHTGNCSNEDPNAALLLELAEKQHWQFCTKCHNMVMKSYGCNHITYVLDSLPRVSLLTIIVAVAAIIFVMSVEETSVAAIAEVLTDFAVPLQAASAPAPSLL